MSVSELLLLNASYIMVGSSYIRWDDDDVWSVLDQHSKLNFYSVSSRYTCHLTWTHYLDSESTSPSLTPKNSVLIGKATNNSFIVSDLTW